MPEPVAPKKPAARKWILWGCGCGGFVIVALAAIFGYILWQVGKSIDRVGEQGAAYLSGRPEVVAEVGAVQKIDRNPLKMNVQVRNDQGEAWFTYTVTGSKGTAEAEVWLVKSAGQWQPVGAKLVVGGKTVPIGNPGAAPPSNRKD